MASERFKPHSNFQTGGLAGGYSSADAENAQNPTLIVLRLDPTTKRLLVDVNGATPVTDGEAVNSSDTGTLMLGTDGSNYQVVSTDSSGHLQVDVLSGGGGGTLVTDGEAVDVADTGSLVLGTDGANYQIISTDSDGHLQVDVLTGGGGGTQYTEGDTDASITGTALMFEGAANTLIAAPGTAADGLLVNLGSNNDVTIAANSSVNVTQIGGNAITAGAGSVAAGTPRVTLASDDPAVALLGTIDADTSALVALILTTQADDVLNTADGLQVTNFNMVFDGTTWDRLRGTSTDGALVNLGTNNDVVDTAAEASLSVIDDWDETDRAKVNIIVGQAGITAGAGAVAANTPRVTMASDSPDVSSLATIVTNTGNTATSLGIMDDWDNGASDGASVSGDVAHDTADAGEPVKVGGKATDVGTTITAVSNNDRVNASFLRNGVQLVLGGETNIISKNLNVTDADGAQTDAALVTVSAGTAIVVTKASVMLDAATTATGGVAARIGFGTASVPAADSNGIILAHPGIPAGSGVIEGNGSGIIGVGASNEDLRLTCEDPTGGNLDVIVTYFTIAIG